MSVAVYHDGVLAADSLWSSGGMVGHVHHKSPKIIRTHNGAGGIAISGALGWEPVLKKVWEEMGRPEDAVGSTAFIRALEGAESWSAILVYDKMVLEASDINPPHYAIPPVVIGSGSAFAIGALSMGASAYDAVKVAIKHSSECGGKITCLTF